jgi:serine/threonine protein kinase
MEEQYRVVLKFCQNRGKIDEFMREANLMVSLPPHPNVVQVFGVCIEETQPIIVMEYCSGGLSVNEMERYRKKRRYKHISINFSLSQLFKSTTHNHTLIQIENTDFIVFFLTFDCLKKISRSYALSKFN